MTYVTPGHPVKDGAGYDCNCGECLAHREHDQTDALALRIEEERQETAAERDHLYRLLLEALDVADEAIDYVQRVDLAAPLRERVQRIRESGGGAEYTDDD